MVMMIDVNVFIIFFVCVFLLGYFFDLNCLFFGCYILFGYFSHSLYFIYYSLEKY